MFKTIIISTLLILLQAVFAHSYAPLITQKQSVWETRWQVHQSIREAEQAREEFEEELQITLDYIKKHEGLMLQPYKCVAGYLTIYYGHVILDGESFKGTEQEANKVLKQDFMKFYNGIKIEFHGRDSTQKKIALAHMAFNIGLGNLYKSTLYKTAKEDPKRVKEEHFMVWCTYVCAKTGLRKQHKLLLEMRKYEYNKYNKFKNK